MTERIKKLYTDAGLKPPNGKGLHTFIFHQCAVNYLKKGMAKDEAYKRCMGGLGKEKALIKQSLNEGGKINMPKITTNIFQTIATNFLAPIRYDTMVGKNYLVVPMIMLTEGVHTGSNGALLYLKEDMSMLPVVWNHKPVIVYHPEKDGQGISACTPIILTNRQIGIIMNTRIDGDKLKAEAWIDETLCNKVDDRIIPTLEQDKMIELSTGLFTDNELIEGEFKGKKYEAIARNYRPDHLAILPDMVGACSVKDGAGLNRNQKEDKINKNEESYSNIRKDLLDYIDNKYSKNSYIEDVYNSFFIYEKEGKLYKQEYKIVNSKATPEGQPQEVVRTTEYRALDGSFIGNINKEKNMDKKKIVKKIIENSNWTDDDKDFLMKLEEGQLEKMIPVKNENKDKDKNKDAQKIKDLEKEIQDLKAVKKENAPAVNKSTENVTVEEYVSNAPDDIRDMLISGIKSHQVEKAKLIKGIIDNKANVFTPEQLANKRLEELKSIAVLAVKPEEKKRIVNLYAGMGDAVNNSDYKEEPMETPVLNFGGSKTK